MNNNKNKINKTSTTKFKFKRIFSSKTQAIVSSLLFASFSYISFKLYYVHKLPESKKLNLVFDLDDTLIVTKKKSKMDRSNLSNKMKHVESSDGKYYIWPRPYISPVLHCLSYFTNLHLFTRATKPYTDDICNKIKINEYFKTKLYREDCDNFGKNLTKINSDTSRSLLIDNLNNNRVDEQNFYHMPEFEASNKNDTELLKFLCHILKKCVLE